MDSLRLSFTNEFPLPATDAHTSALSEYARLLAFWVLNFFFKSIIPLHETCSPEICAFVEYPLNLHCLLRSCSICAGNCITLLHSWVLHWWPTLVLRSMNHTVKQDSYEANGYVEVMRLCGDRAISTDSRRCENPTVSPRPVRALASYQMTDKCKYSGDS